MRVQCTTEWNGMKMKRKDSYPSDLSEYIRSFGLRHDRTRSLRRGHVIIVIHSDDDLAVRVASCCLKERMRMTHMHEIEDAVHVDARLSVDAPTFIG